MNEGLVYCATPYAAYSTSRAPYVARPTREHVIFVVLRRYSSGVGSSWDEHDVLMLDSTSQCYETGQVVRLRSGYWALSYARRFEP